MKTIVRKLHIGCFDQVITGWIDADVTPHLFVARIPGLAALFFWMGRINEHRYRQHRQGVFRQVRYRNAARRFPYAPESFECIYSSHLLEHLYPRQAEAFAELVFDSRQQQDKNAHHWHYNQDSLGRTLEEAGFLDVRRRGPLQGICPDVERLDSRSESLFMEAVK